MADAANMEKKVEDQGICCGDAFSELPPEMRPKPETTKGSLRNIECPRCGLKYWTNRSQDVCITCERAG